MATKVYGESDDLIEFEGDVCGEVGNYQGDDNEGCLLMFSDGTVIVAKYGKPGDGGLWGMTTLKKGTLYIRTEECTEETDAGHSDIVHFADGLKWAYAAKDWERVK